jgi:hypothetical protein
MTSSKRKFSGRIIINDFDPSVNRNFGPVRIETAE